MSPLRRLLTAAAAAVPFALALPAQHTIPAYPERDILSPFRYPQEVYAPPDKVYELLRIMRDLADDPSTHKQFDAQGIEVVEDPRWQRARTELQKLVLDAGYLAQILRLSKNADDRDVALYGAFFCSDPAYVCNLIGHIPGEPEVRARQHAFPRAIAWLRAHLGRRWGDLSKGEQQALNIPAVGSPAANAAGLKHEPRDGDFLYSVNLRPFIQLLALDSAIDQAQGAWFLKECCLMREDLALQWLEPVLPRLQELLHSKDAQVKEQVTGLFLAIAGSKFESAPTDEQALDAWAERAGRRMFPPIRVISEALVLLLPSADLDAIAATGRAGLLDGSLGDTVMSRTPDGMIERGFRVTHVPEDLAVLQIPEGAMITAINGSPVDDAAKLVALIERALQLRKDQKGHVTNPTRSLLVEFSVKGVGKAIEYRVQ